jgi:ABC-2 type transport system ATP-binding protein
MDAVIQTTDLCKYFQGKAAVDHLTMAVPGGAVFALLGDNGAGKTTTIRMLTGLLPADSGTAHILGQDCWGAASKLRGKVAYVPERPRYYDWMTVAEIGWFSAGFHGKDYSALFQKWCSRLELNPKAKLSTLSKGQYAKVGLALAMAIDPQVLILDEPTSGLDLLVRREFLESMVGLAAEGRTILISSHQIAEVERVASHVAFIAQGRMLMVAGLEELKQRIVRLKLRFESHPPEAANLGTVLQRNGAGKHWQVVLQDPRPDSLDQLQSSEGIHDIEISPLHLEEIYYALLSRKGGQP